MKDRSVQLTPRQRAAFIVVDGKRTMAQVLAATAAAGVTREDIDRLFELGLVADPKPGKNRAELEVGQPQAGAVEQRNRRTPQERYAAAYPIAARLTAGLGLMGFRLNLAVEGASSYEQLLEVVPKIRAAVGAEKCRLLDSALNDR